MQLARISSPSRQIPTITTTLKLSDDSVVPSGLGPEVVVVDLGFWTEKENCMKQITMVA